MAKRYHDGGMIGNDSSGMANMPQNVIIKKYPESPGYSPETLNDSISGIDSQMGKDNAGKMKNRQKGKY